MENKSNPFYLKLSSTLITIALLLVLLVAGRNVLVPIFFACIFCIFLIAPCNMLERWGVPRTLAVTICVLLALIVMSAVLYFISDQLISFKSAMPELINNLNKASDKAQNYLHKRYHIDYYNVGSLTDNLRTKVLTSIPAILGSTFSTISGVLKYVILIPIYTFLLLLYRGLIVRFIVACFRDAHQNSVVAMLGRTKYVIRSYIFGLLIEMTIVAAMTFVGLLIIGSQYALLLAFIVALLNLIPYVGIATAAIISIIVTISSGNPMTVIGVLIVIVCVYAIDSNFLLPKIVGSRVKINALATTIGVVVGCELWGIPGMFLAMPVMAILKVLFESVGDLHAWGVLLGEEESQPVKKNKLARLLKKKTKK